MDPTTEVDDAVSASEPASAPEAFAASDPEALRASEVEAASSSEPEAFSSSEPEAFSSSEPEVVSSSEAEAFSFSDPEAAIFSEEEAISSEAAWFSEAEAASAAEAEAASAAEAEAASASESQAAPNPEAGVSTALRGAWTVARGPELLELARSWDASSEDMEVDCAALERLDTAAFQVLIAVRRAFAARGFTLSLTNMPENIEKHLRLAGLEQELLA